MNAQRRESFDEVRHRTLIALTFGPGGLGDAAAVAHAAADQAYRDWCTTLRLAGLPSRDARRDLREEATRVLIAGLYRLFAAVNQEQFDARHRELRAELGSVYGERSLDLHHGQAQKWINMAAKYLLLLGDAKAADARPLLHAAVDTVVIERARHGLEIDHPASPWSTLGEEECEDYQAALRHRIHETPDWDSPIDWEFAARLQA